jgi:hypothetical protein
MDRRLDKLQTKVKTLQTLVSKGFPPDMNHVLHCEVLIQELLTEHESLSTLLASGSSTPELRKIQKDYTRYVPKLLQCIALANQACFEARLSLEQQQSPPPSLPKEEEESGNLQQLHLLQQAVMDQITDPAALKELKTIEQKTQTILALNENIAGMITSQAEDVNHVSRLSTNARDDAVNGLGALAEKKKKEAGKHTYRGMATSAVIGGGIGMIGGPFGVVIGATAGVTMGSLIGSTVTKLSRKNIDREVRNFVRLSPQRRILHPNRRTNSK